MIEDMLSPYFLHLEEKCINKATVNDYISEVSNFLCYLGKKKIDPKLDNISEDVLDAYFAWLSDNGYSETSIAERARRLRHFFDYCEDKGKISSNPVKKQIVQKTISVMHDYLTNDEIKTLVAAVNNETGINYLRDKLLIVFLLYMGIRHSEVAIINWSAIDFEESMILNKKWKKGTVQIFGMGEELKEIVSAYYEASAPKNQDDALFTDVFGRRLNTRSIHRIVRDYAKKAGIRRRISPLTSKHTHALHTKQDNARSQDMQIMPGHDSNVQSERMDMSDNTSRL